MLDPKKKGKNIQKVLDPLLKYRPCYASRKNV